MKKTMAGEVLYVSSAAYDGGNGGRENFLPVNGSIWVTNAYSSHGVYCVEHMVHDADTLGVGMSNRNGP